MGSLLSSQSTLHRSSMFVDRPFGQLASVTSKSVSLIAVLFDEPHDIVASAPRLHGAQTIVIVGQAGSQDSREPMPKVNNHFAKNINRATIFLFAYSTRAGAWRRKERGIGAVGHGRS